MDFLWVRDNSLGGTWPVGSSTKPTWKVSPMGPNTPPPAGDPTAWSSALCDREKPDVRSRCASGAPRSPGLPGSFCAAQASCRSGARQCLTSAKKRLSGAL